MARKQNNRIIWILLTLVIILVIVVIVWKRGDHGTPVEIDTAERRTIVEMVSASGKIYPEEEVVIIPEIAGEIIALYVQEGDSVKKDDKLVKINPDLFQDALERAEAAVLTAKANLSNARAREAQAEAQLERTRLDFNRSKQLLADEVIAQSEFDAAQAAYKVAQSELEAARASVEAAKYNVQSAEATLQEAKNNLSRTTVYSPMEGIVTALEVEEGKVVGGISTFAATEMMRVSNLSAMEARVNVSENDILRIALGDTALIEVEAYDDRVFKGVVSQISSSAENAQAQLTSDQATNFTVDIAILPSSYQDLVDADAGAFPLLPGMSAAVDIITTTKKDVLSVPIEAVTTRAVEEDSLAAGSEKEAFLEVVFIPDGTKEKARKVPVETGIQDDQFIEIIKGLNEGDTVITGPYTTVQRLLRDDMAITIKKKKKDTKTPGE